MNEEKCKKVLDDLQTVIDEASPRCCGTSEKGWREMDADKGGRGIEDRHPWLAGLLTWAAMPAVAYAGLLLYVWLVA